MSKSKTEIKQEAQTAIIHAAMNLMTSIEEGYSDVDPKVAREQIARIEKMFGYVPFSFSN